MKKVITNGTIVHFGSGARCVDCKWFSWNKDGTTGWCSYWKKDIEEPREEDCRFLRTDSDEDEDEDEDKDEDED